VFCHNHKTGRIAVETMMTSLHHPIWDLTNKGERTRSYIIERSAPLFNRQGYAGTSLKDIMEATGLEKGGIYNHFVANEKSL
jgi:AcrR family transcriptional regulator